MHKKHLGCGMPQKRFDNVINQLTTSDFNWKASKNHQQCLKLKQSKAKLNTHYVSEYILFYILGEDVIQSKMGNPEMDSHEESATAFWQDTSRQCFNRVPLLGTGREVPAIGNQSKLPLSSNSHLTIYNEAH